MKYRFKFGRNKKVIISGNESFETLGYKILKEFNIRPEHIYCFEFSNGDVTNCASPLGPMSDGMGKVSIEMKIKDRKMEIGEEMMLVYGPSDDWKKKIKLDGIE